MHIHQHSAEGFFFKFFFMVFALSLAERASPGDLKQIPVLVSQLLFAISSMLPLKLGL